MTLNSSSVSARHCAVDIDHSGRVIVHDLQSRNGTWVDDEPVREPRFLAPGEILRLGAVHLTLLDREPDDRSAVTGLARQHGIGGSTAFNRPPRSAPAPEPPPMQLPTPPREEHATQSFSWISMLIPVGLGSVMALALGPMYALFMLLSPMMMIGNWVEGSRSGKDLKRALQLTATGYGDEEQLMNTLLAANLFLFAQYDQPGRLYSLYIRRDPSGRATLQAFSSESQLPTEWTTWQQSRTRDLAPALAGCDLQINPGSPVTVKIPGEAIIVATR